MLQSQRNNRISILLALNGWVTQTSEERTAALHERLATPTPCEKKEEMGLYLAHWAQDLEKLAEAKSRPSRETTGASLKHLLSKLKSSRM